MIISDVFKALSDQNRLRILNLLMIDELCVCEIEKVLNLSQSNVSRHLLTLKNTQIATCRKKSQWVYYSLNEDFTKEFAGLIEFLQKTLPANEPFKSDLNRLEDLRKEGISC